jgi:ElaB/YqjD/DUF883 family membrane-anchored ribosome-binding protein
MLETAMTENAEGTAGDFAADLAAVRQDLARLAETMSKLVQQQAQAAGNRLFAAVDDAKEKIASSNAKNRICAANSAVEACVEHHPLASVVGAFAIGMSLGLLSRMFG